MTLIKLFGLFLNTPENTDHEPTIRYFFNHILSNLKYGIFSHRKNNSMAKMPGLLHRAFQQKFSKKSRQGSYHYCDPDGNSLCRLK